jgi:hypothetical protein
LINIFKKVIGAVILVRELKTETINQVTNLPNAMLKDANENVPSDPNVVRTWTEWSEYGGGHQWVIYS